MWHDIFLISPLLTVTFFALTAFLAGAFSPRGSNQGWIGSLTAIGFGLAALLTFFQFQAEPESLAFQSHAFQHALSMDAFGLGMSLVVLVGAFLTTLSSISFLPAQKIDHGEFYGLTALSVVGMQALLMSNDLMTFFIAFELMSLSVYVLSGFKRDSLRSTESGMKYFVIGSFTSGLLLLGMAFLYGATGSFSIPAIAAAVPEALAITPGVLRLSMILIFVAFFFKIAAAPCHMWTPDVYEGAPATVTGFMAIAIKTAAYGAFVRLILSVFSAPELRSEGFSWELMVVIAASLSMVLGNLQALAQKNLKRLLAYSAIAQTGYLLLALLVVDTGADGGLTALGGGLMFYLFAYTLANAAAFGVAAAVSADGKDDVNEAAYAGLAKRSPGLALALAISMLSLLGIPLTAGFMGKFVLFEEVLAVKDARYLWLIIFAIVNTIVSAWYYLRVILVAYMHEESEEEPIALSQGRAMTLSLALASLGILLVGVLPNKVVESTKKAGEAVSSLDTREAESTSLLGDVRVGHE